MDWIWGNIPTGESLDKNQKEPLDQPMVVFTPVFIREIQRFRTQTWGSNGKLMGKFMGDDGIFGTNTMKYECV